MGGVTLDSSAKLAEVCWQRRAGEVLAAGGLGWVFCWVGFFVGFFFPPLFFFFPLPAAQGCNLLKEAKNILRSKQGF